MLHFGQICLSQRYKHGSKDVYRNVDKNAHFLRYNFSLSKNLKFISESPYLTKHYLTFIVLVRALNRPCSHESYFFCFPSPFFFFLIVFCDIGSFFTYFLGRFICRLVFTSCYVIVYCLLRNLVQSILFVQNSVLIAL